VIKLVLKYSSDTLKDDVSYQEVLIIDAKLLSEVSKHQRAVLLELEMAGHVLPVCIKK